MNLEIVKTLLDYQLDWIEKADNKVTPLLAINTGMLGTLAIIVPPPLTLATWKVVIPLAPALLSFAAIAMLAMAVRPDTKGPIGSVVYFGGIAAESVEFYREKLLAISPSELERDFISQVHRNAQIAFAKHRSVRQSIYVTCFSFVFWLYAVHFHLTEHLVK